MEKKIEKERELQIFSKIAAAFHDTFVHKYFLLIKLPVASCLSCAPMKEANNHACTPTHQPNSK